MKKRINGKIIIIFLTILQLIFVSESLCADIPNNQRGIGIKVKDTETGVVQDVPLYRKMHAVIIGIDKYLNLPPDKQLSYAVNDAKGVEKVLRDKYRFDKDNIYTLYNEKATKFEILKVLEGELSKIDEQDAVFVFFAGHGTTLEVGKTDKRKLDYIIPYDGTFKQDEMYRNISLSELKNDIGDIIPAKHLFYVLDSCYSGALLANTRSGGINPEEEYAYLKASTSKPIRQAFTAGADGQTVLDGGPKGHSVFTGQFIKKLEEAHNYITAKTLGRDVTGAVILDANKQRHNQTPIMGKFSGDDGGDFVFVPKILKTNTGNPVKPGGTLVPVGYSTKEKSVLSMAADPTGNIIAVGGIRGVELFEARDEKSESLGSFESGTAVSLQFSPDGKKLAIGGYKKIYIGDISTRQIVNLPTHHTDFIVSLIFSPDGTVLASGSMGSDRTIEILNLKDKKIIDTFKREHENPEETKFIQFSPDGKLLAASSLNDKEILKIWTMENSQAWRKVDLSEDKELAGTVIKSMAFSPDGKYLVAGLNSGNILVYNFSSNLTRTLLSVHSKPVIGVRFTKDSRYLISGGLDNSIKYIDIEDDETLNWQKIEGEFNLLEIIPKTDVIKEGMIITSDKSKAYKYILPDF